VPVRIYAFAKELGFDNKQLLDICDSAGIEDKGSALASLTDEEVVAIKDYLASPPPAVEEVPQPPEEFEAEEEFETGQATEPDDETAVVQDAPVIQEVPAEREAPAQQEAPVVQDDPAEQVAVDDSSTAESPVQDDASQTGAATEDAAPADDEKPAKPKSVVSGLLGKLRSRSKEVMPSVKATTGTPIIKKASIHDMAAKGKGKAKSKSVVEPPAVPQEKITPSTSKTPTRNPLFARSQKVVRDLDSRPQKSEGGEEKKRPVKKRGITASVAKMPEVKQPTSSVVPGEKVQKPDIALPQDAINQIQRGGAAPLEHLTKSAKKGKKKGKGSDTESKPGEVFGEMPSKVRRSSAQRGDTPLGGLRNRRPQRNYRSRPGTRRSRGKVVNSAAPRKDAVVLQLPCTVREFSEAAGVPAVQALLTLQQLGDDSVKTINSVLPAEMVELLVDHFESSVEVRQQQTAEDAMMAEYDVENEDEDSLVPRAPIVTFLGHVDHGKTSLLDALIGIDVVSGEAGGITQHIRAYEVKKGEQKIAFVDTPGHEAFTEMRARGANVTDIAVLVVAADDGIMPQTEEAITHAKAAGVPIIVALNKIDIPGITPDKALQDLASAELLPSEWGGDTEVVKTSAIAGTGLDELLETILVTAELYEYKANPERSAFGTCLESEQQSDRGVVCKIMVQGGTLNVGDIVVCGAAHGRVKAMHDTLHPKRRLTSAGPSTPVNLTGFNTAPGAGDKLYVVEDVATAREIAEKRLSQQHEQDVSGTVKVSLEEMQRRLESGNLASNEAELITLNLIIRADTKGSIEAIKKELGKIEHPEVRIKIIQALVGGVSVADVRLAQASEAVVCAFNVVPDEAARSLADEVNAEIRRYEVIYKITDDLKAMLEGRLKPEEHVVDLGMAMVMQTFSVSKTGTIAGCRVMRGTIARDCRMRVIRENTVIGDYPIESLKREKDDAKEVQRGMECGIKLSGFNDVKEGDTLEAYKIEEIARTL
jgi:translation initiation factor IF-2